MGTPKYILRALTSHLVKLSLIKIICYYSESHHYPDPLHTYIATKFGRQIFGYNSGVVTAVEIYDSLVLREGFTCSEHPCQLLYVLQLTVVMQFPVHLSNK